jgi:hypothetical protein
MTGPDSKRSGTTRSGTQARTSSPRRELTASLLLVATGAVLLLVSAGRAWEPVTTAVPDSPTAHVARTGSDIAQTGVVGVLALAGVVGLVAASGWARRAVALVLVVAAALAVAAVVRFLGAPGPAAWAGPTAGLLGAALVALGAGAALVRGGHWPGMSSRYDREAAPEGPARGLWEAMDRGTDPTEIPGNR